LDADYFQWPTLNKIRVIILSTQYCRAYTIFRPRGGGISGQCVLLDNAVPIKGALKTQVLENACTENASTMQTFSQIKKLVLHKLVWCIFKWGGKVDYRLFFLR